MKGLVFILTLGLPGLCSWADVSALVNTKELEFAHHLQMTGDYPSAYAEYYRYYYNNRANAETAVLEQLGSVSYKLEKYLTASNWYYEAFLIDGSRNEQYKILSILSRFRSGLLENEQLGALDSVKYFLQSDFERAAELEDQLPENLNNLLPEINERGRGYRDKSPVLSSIFSAIFPGGGYFYNGDVRTGLTSLMFLGLSGYFTYDTYMNGGVENPFFWLSSSAFFTFYGGSVYGGYTGAIRKNQIFRQNLYNEFWEKVDHEYWP